MRAHGFTNHSMMGIALGIGGWIAIALPEVQRLAKLPGAEGVPAGAWAILAAGVVAWIVAGFIAWEGVILVGIAGAVLGWGAGRGVEAWLSADVAAVVYVRLGVMLATALLVPVAVGVQEIRARRNALAKSSEQRE